MRPTNPAPPLPPFPLLQVSEDMGPGGLFWGCLNGLCRYIFCCHGFLTIYCGQSSTSKTKSHKRGIVHAVRPAPAPAPAPAP